MGITLKGSTEVTITKHYKIKHWTFDFNVLKIPYGSTAPLSIRKPHLSIFNVSSFHKAMFFCPLHMLLSMCVWWGGGGSVNFSLPVGKLSSKVTVITIWQNPGSVETQCPSQRETLPTFGEPLQTVKDDYTRSLVLMITWKYCHLLLLISHSFKQL